MFSIKIPPVRFRQSQCSALSRAAGRRAGANNYVTNSFQFQNYTSISMVKHFLKFGARFDDDVLSSSSNANFNGVFTFPSIQAYQVTEQGVQAGLTPAQIQANGGGATQFTLTAGNPLATLNYYDLEPYVEDDWKVRPNLTISGGLRFEIQNHLSDHSDFAPRLAIAWGLGKGKTPQAVLRAGFGIFYDRFGENYILNEERLNGINQQQYIVPSPGFFPTIPPISTLSTSAVSPTIYQVDPTLRTPYTTQGGVAWNHKLPRTLRFR